MQINKFLFLLVTPIFAILIIKIIAKTAKPLILLYFPAIFEVSRLLINASNTKISKNKYKVNAFIKLCQKTILDNLKLIPCIQVTKNSDDIVVIHALDHKLYGLPRHLWFGEMTAFCKEKFGINPLYIDFQKFTIQMISINPIEFCEENIWQDFPSHVKENKKIRNILKFKNKSNDFFQKYFNIDQAIKLIPDYHDSTSANFIIQINIASLEQKQQEKIEQIIRQEILDIELTNLMGILSLGPIKEISDRQIIKIQKKLKQEFQPDSNAKYSTDIHEFHFFNPTQLYWKPKKFKPKIIDEKNEIKIVTQFFEQKPIYFDDKFGTFNPKDPKCLIKPLPDGPPNTFIIMHPGLRKELKNTDRAEDIVWFTEDFDEKIHKPPTIQKTHEKINSDGNIPIFKIYFLRSEYRATCNQWGQVTQQGKTYTLYIVDEYYDKLHKRTTCASAATQKTAEKRQMISFNLS